MPRHFLVDEDRSGPFYINPEEFLSNSQYLTFQVNMPVHTSDFRKVTITFFFIHP